jgi:hypothetical protein
MRVKGILMPKANPFVQIAKKLASLEAKSVKVNEELKALAVIVDAEMKKQEAAPVPAKAPVTAANPSVAPKKRGRPAKK